MPKILSKLLSRSIFQQHRQIVDTQININQAIIPQLSHAFVKPHPKLDQAAYRLDRRPQCRALIDFLNARETLKRPLIVFVLGTEDHLPESAGITLMTAIARGFLKERSILPFRPHSKPLCREWPNVCDQNSLWQTVAETFLGNSGRFVTTRDRIFQDVAGSLVFGFHIDQAAWRLHERHIQNWVTSLSAIACSPTKMVLSIIAMSAPPGSDTDIEATSADLRHTFKDLANVIVLPALSPVTRNDIRMWREEIVSDGSYPIDVAELDTLVGDIFPERETALPMQSLWRPLRARIRGACVPNA